MVKHLPRILAKEGKAAIKATTVFQDQPQYKTEMVLKQGWSFTHQE